MGVSLDDRPLSESRRWLIQTMTEDRPYGFRAEGGTIQSLGAPPFGVREIQVTLEPKGQPFRRAVILDLNAYPR
ncbi:MAG: hypothetical protein KatS3mg115_2098 [Candidatus Poribacteria bacterium]|nr:MAG: hypothetical protein KatS3mg115_2098 [Candidatus Poribacteria bacterium]